MAAPGFTVRALMQPVSHWLSGTGGTCFSPSVSLSGNEVKTTSEFLAVSFGNLLLNRAQFLCQNFFFSFYFSSSLCVLLFLNSHTQPNLFLICNLLSFLDLHILLGAFTYFPLD